MEEYSSFYLFMAGFIGLVMAVVVSFTWIYKKIANKD